MEEIYMTSKQRAYLRSLAQNTAPIMQIGKQSITPEITSAVSECFNTHELIKISILKNCFDDPKDIASKLSERTHSELIHVIGKKITLYKPFNDKPVITLPNK
jgi:RNA-binding protein